jgi:pyruvate dehydrogenase E1 component
VLPEVVDAARVLGKHGIVAGVVCLTSPDLVFRSWEARSRAGAHSVSPIIEDLFPATYSAPLVAVLDGHPHTLSFLAGARGDPIRCLGVRDFGQSSSLTDAYALHEIDSPAIVDADLALVSR